MLYEEFLKYKAEKNAETIALMKLPMEENKEENTIVADKLIYDTLQNFGLFLNALAEAKQDRHIAAELYEMQKRILQLETDSKC